MRPNARWNVGRFAIHGERRIKVIAAFITVSILLGLTFASVYAGGAASTADGPLDVTLTGDETVERNDVVTLELTVEQDVDERVRPDGFLLTITDREEGTLEQVFAADGSPVETKSNSTKIATDELKPTLEKRAVIEPGYEHKPGYERLPLTVTYKLTLNATAFDVNDYDAHVDLVTAPFDELPADGWPSDDLETAHTSTVHSFAITPEPDPVDTEEPERQPASITVEELTITVDVERMTGAEGVTENETGVLVLDVGTVALVVETETDSHTVRDHQLKDLCLLASLLEN